jgi:aspartokinase
VQYKIAELCYFGARIAHPRTFEPAAAKKIPVRLFNINDFSEELKPVTVIEDKGIIKVAIYFIIDKKENVRAVNSIHKEFFV